MPFGIPFPLLFMDDLFFIITITSVCLGLLLCIRTKPRMTSTVDNWQAPFRTIPLKFDFSFPRKDIYPPVSDLHDGKKSTTWQSDERQQAHVPDIGVIHKHPEDLNTLSPQGAVDDQQQIGGTQPGKAPENALPTRNFQFSTLGRSIPKKSSHWELEEPREASTCDDGYRIVRKAVAVGTPEGPRNMPHVPKLSIQTDNLENYPSQRPDLPELHGSMPAVLQDSESNINDNDSEEKWQENEIPEELGYIDMDEPEEIRNIVQESLDEHRALRASRMHTQAIVVRTTITMSTAGRRASICDPVVESSAMSPNQSLELVSSRERLDAQDLAFESSSSVGSSIGDQDLRSLRTSPELLPTSSQESLGSSTGSSEMRMPSKRERRRDQGLFKLLPIRTSRKPKKADPADGLPVAVTTSECTSCFDDIPNKEAIDVPCRHEYCPPCFSQLVTTAILSEDTFPPKCCLQDIPRRILQSHISPEELAAFDEKALEYAVPTGSRYYCGSPACAKWIDTRKARRLSGGLQCPHCRFKMCTSCRGAQHSRNQDCPQDFGLGAALEQAERAGWQRCYSCRTMVELNRGCRHITCKCGAEFCYTCGAKWRTCACTEADQTQREAEAAERLARYEAETRAEEAEVRAAIAAVEEAERRVAEEREAEERAAEEARQAEEAEEATKIEYERVEGINDFFQWLRGELRRIDQEQKQAIASRHEMHDIPSIVRMQTDLAADSVYKRRMRQITSERGALLAGNDRKIQELRQQHRSTLITTLKRHRDDQDTVFLQPIRGPETHRGTITEHVLALLTAAQEFELHTVEAQHERDVRKWRARGAAQLAEFDAIMREEQERFEKVHRRRTDRVGAALAKAEAQIASDWRWFETLVQARGVMLGEDEGRMIMSGADAPEEFFRIKALGVGVV